MGNSKGQNLIEYILLVTAVVIVCIFFFARGGPMSAGVNAALNSMVNQVDNLSGQIRF
jgi:hypothetical protein